MNKKITLITGNLSKAKYFSKYLDIEIDHLDVDLDEIQSLDLKEIVKHKVMQAYDRVNGPVLVEDVSLEFSALGKLPGPFIKFFLKELSLIEICNLIKDKSRDATARCVIGYYDGLNLDFFEGELFGQIALFPEGKKDFGWDPIFIPEGYNTTRAQLNDEDYKDTYLKIRRIDLLQKYLLNNDF